MGIPTAGANRLLKIDRFPEEWIAAGCGTKQDIFAHFDINKEIHRPLGLFSFNKLSIGRRRCGSFHRMPKFRHALPGRYPFFGQDRSAMAPHIRAQGISRRLSGSRHGIIGLKILLAYMRGSPWKNRSGKSSTD